jgi:hypothetical protein
VLYVPFAWLVPAVLDEQCHEQHEVVAAEPTKTNRSASRQLEQRARTRRCTS